VHFEKDAYRLIWEPDYERNVVIVLRVGKKVQRRGTIYGQPRPDTPHWPQGTE
jgi:hypothetical protein